MDISEDLRAVLEQIPDDDQSLVWEDPSDLSRFARETIVAQAEGDARSLSSTGYLRLRGPGVVEHGADLDATGMLAATWQRAVTAVASALEGYRSSRGRISPDVRRRSQLTLSAAPSPGSLVLHIEAKAPPLPEAEPQGDRPLFLSDRPLVDRSAETLVGLCSGLASSQFSEQDAVGTQLRDLGPRVASAVRSLADLASRGSFALDVGWEEPGGPTRRSSWDVGTAQWVRSFIDGRDLDSEVVDMTGIAVTVSNRERWLLEVGDETVKVVAADLPIEEVRKVSPGDRVTLRVRTAVRQQADGTMKASHHALDIRGVVPFERLEASD